MSETGNLFTGGVSTNVGLGRIRKRLLDLTKRNRLLNFYDLSKTTRGSGRLLRIIDTSPDRLFKKLYLEGKSALIEPIPDPDREHWEVDENDKPRRPEIKKQAILQAINPEFHLDGSGNGGIRALLYPDQLEASLRKIDQAARSAIEETGTNILQVVFGFLEWYESEDSDRPLLAPLLILPASLKRDAVDKKTGFFTYTVEYSGEDLSDNITLRQKLHVDFGLELPELDEEDTPESYFAKIETWLHGKRRWCLRRQACLCLLSFGKLLMYLDLDPDRWPSGQGLADHSLIKAFFEGAERGDGQSFATEYSIDDNPEASAVPLVLDADSSQHSALIDALRGQNMVIEGPPGTGKSQTITNLIAAALASNKTVLFISEKLAALEVVRRNMEKAQLGKFCLELHSHKTQKRKLLDDIKARKEMTLRPPTDFDSKLKELEATKKKLQRYVQQVNSVKENNLNKTVHQILWSFERARQAIGELANHLNVIYIEQAILDTPFEFAEKQEAIHQLSRHLEALPNRGSDSPWHGYFPASLLFGDDQRIAEVLDTWHRQVVADHAYISVQQQNLPFALPRTPVTAESLIGQVFQIPPPSGDHAFDLLPAILNKVVRGHLSQLEESVAYINSHKQLVDSNFFHAPTQQDKLKATAVLDKATKIGMQNVPWSELHSRAMATKNIITSLKSTIFHLQEMGRALEISCQTWEQVEAVAAAVAAIGAAPVALLDLRDTIWFEQSALPLTQRAADEQQCILQQKQAVEKMFLLADLPDTSEIADTMRAISEGSNVFRLLRSSWRTSAKLYRRIRLGEKPRWLNSSTCASELKSLREYLLAKEKFENTTEYHTLFGRHFQGIETDLSTILQVVAWQVEFKRLLLPHSTPGKGFSYLTIFALPTDTLAWTASHQNETAGQTVIRDEYWKELETIFPENTRPPNLVPNAQVEISKHIEWLDSVANGIETWVKVLSEIFKTAVSPAKAYELSCVGEELIRHQQILLDNPAIPILGKYFKDADTDFHPIRNTVAWCDSVRGQSEFIGCTDWLLTPDLPNNFTLLGEIAARYTGWLDAHKTAISALESYGSLSYEDWFGNVDPDFDVIEERLKRAMSGLELLNTWADMSRAIVRLKDLGLAAIADLGFANDLTVDKLTHAFRYVYYHSIVRTILQKNAELMLFSGLSHGQIRERYNQLDNEIIHLTGEKVAFNLALRHVPPGNGRGPVRSWTDDALLSNELNKQRRHIPIRQLVARAGNALFALKPCFMMGPLSVAQYLPAGQLKFDLVVMDEASQLKPEDALGAVARGAQLVVVGDPKQLPPTSFFDKLVGDDGQDEEDTSVDEAESILEVCSSIFQPVHRLRWHYRSQHHSLIAFSNRHFYSERPLVIFPSPHGASNGLGIRKHFLPNGIYEGLRNKVEASRVADAVIEHILNRHDESLGVVTLNISQRDLVEEEIDNRIKIYPKAMEILGKWQNSGFPFFVKNLENVQGDERDVIFISTTYGKNGAGNFFMRFGPINQQQGWRRLNVLFTRAKRRIELFTSIDPADMRVDVNSPRGVKALRDYLEYAENGLLETPEYTQRDFDSEFEVAVAEVLTENGYEAVPQLGVAGFFIDLAVRHPLKPGEFIAGIECDGASYHSGLSVRDRDRLRQEVLERLGWRGKIYRIWSTDWFKNPKEQTGKLLAFLGSATQRAMAEAPVQPIAKRIEPLPEVVAAPTFAPFYTPGQGDNDLIIEVGDFITYCYTDNEDNEISVQIIDGASQPIEGLINENTPLAKTLLGLRVGDEEELRLPLGKKIVKVLDIQR